MHKIDDMKEKFDFEPFSETEEYRKVNGDIIDSWIETMLQAGMNSLDRLLDIATGAGTMVQLFFDHLPANWKRSLVVCLDQSSEALKLAQSKLDKNIEKLKFIHSSVEDMSIPDESMDIVVWGNGIHYLSEDDQLDSLKRIRKALKPGGWFFFNTAFYEEARPESTIPFYRTQVKKAVELLRNKGVSRLRGETRAEASKFLPRSYYEELVELAGLKLVEAREYTADLSKEAWEHISAFQQYAAGALRGYPINEASLAMKSAVEAAINQHGVIDENGKLHVVRKWLAVSAKA